VNYTAPDARDYPGLREFNGRWLLLSWSSRVRSTHISSIVKAVRKVIAAIQRTPDAARGEEFELAAQAD
jgi:hypothetical protein